MEETTATTLQQPPLLKLSSSSDVESDDGDVTVYRILDRLPKRRRHDPAEKELEAFRDAWVDEINVLTAFVGGMDAPLLHRVFTFLDLPAAVNVMLTCSTWRDMVCRSSLGVWLGWCTNTIPWKLIFPVPKTKADMIRNDVVRYRSRYHWARAAVETPPFSLLWACDPPQEPPLRHKMHFHDNIMGICSPKAVTVLHFDTSERKSAPVPDASAFSLVSVSAGHVVTAEENGNVRVYRTDLRLIEVITTKMPALTFTHVEDDFLAVGNASGVRIYDLNTSARVYDFGTANPLRWSSSQRENITFNLSSMDICGNILVMANADVIELRDLRQRKSIATLPCGNVGRAVRIDAKSISCIDNDSLRITVWDLNSLSPRSVEPVLAGDTFHTHCAHAGKIVASCASRTVQVCAAPGFSYNIPHNELHPLAQSIHQIQCDWERIVVACDDGSFYTWSFG